MLDFSRLDIMALAAFSRGARLHQAGLHAMHERRWDDAERLFEAAAARYRREIEVQALARLRVHQMMARVFAAGDFVDTERCLEVERRLCQLERIESLAPPFELVDAHSMLARWLDDPAESAAPSGESATDLGELPLGRAA
jgi:hypothetical protein